MFSHTPLGGTFLRASRKPSPYPALPFHLIKTAQVLAAFICGAILSFFVDHLRDEGYAIPWTFLLLLTTSLLTVVHYITSIYIHFTRTLNPKPHLISNAVLTVCWLVSLALLTWNLSWTLGHRCGPINWHNNAGIMVCRLYKALTAFATVGAATTAGALGLDLTVQRKAKARGNYNQMGGGDVKTPAINVKEVGGGDGFEGQDLRHFGEGHERRSHEGAQVYKIQKPIEARQFGYEAPSEQTSYGGGHN